MGRAHGLGGEVVVRLFTDRLERVAAGSVLHTHAGRLRVRSSRPHQHRHLVSFEGVADRAAAQALAGCLLYAEPIDEPGTLWAHQLIGCEVVDAEGRFRGTVVALEDNPASDLLVLDTGALVPLRFLVDGPTPESGPKPDAGPSSGSGLGPGRGPGPDALRRRLVVDTPPGLFDL